MFKKVDPENARLAAHVAEILMTLPSGGVVTYDALAEMVGTEVRGTHILQRARKKAELELGCLYEPERGVGVRRVEPHLIPEVGLAAIGRVRRAAKRASGRLGRVNVNSLSVPQAGRIIGYRAMLGAIALVADGRRALAVAAVADPNRSIPPESILEMFMVKK